MLKPVLLSGGIGSRLWPLSREAHPKQFQPLLGSNSMLQETLLRLAELDADSPVVICNEAHRFLVAEQMRQADIQPGPIILEPEGRNTAPAVALAALQAAQVDSEAVLLVLPADHAMARPEAFVSAVNTALPLAKQGYLITFGVVPSRAETGYGYLRCGDELQDGVRVLDQFVEKPDTATAQQYLESGDYLWNSGMFLLPAAGFLEELQAHNPAMLEACQQALAGASHDLDFVRLDKEAFLSCPADSIDYAVMEKTSRGGVIPLDCGWSDVGAWSSVWEASAQDTEGNAVFGDVLLKDSSNSYLASHSRLVAALGIDNLVVVETPDAVLVADRERVQDVKAIVASLKDQDRIEAALHTRVYRPWGSYESLVISDRFQVKRIEVKPGGKLSLQKHHHRAEHWIVVKGTAEVTCEDRVFMLAEDESTYIPIGHKHRLANPGRITLELIEVQSGSYLGEDDIVRYDDDYGRKS